MEEVWKDVKGYEGYYKVSNYGNIKSIRSSKLLSFCTLKVGYYMANFQVNGKRKGIYAHRIVAEAFVEKPVSLDRLVVDHIDGNRLNNNSKNLQWISDRDNVLKGNAINKNKLLGVHYHKNSDNYSCFLRIKKDRIHLAYHKSDVFYLSKVYNKAVELRNEYNGDKDSFRKLVKSFI